MTRNSPCVSPLSALLLQALLTPCPRRKPRADEEPADEESAAEAQEAASEQGPGAERESNRCQKPPHPDR